MEIQILSVPYDSGHRFERMGRGPERFVRAGLADFLNQQGHPAFFEEIVSEADFPTEIGTSFELYRLLAGRVRAAVERGRFPLLLSGNCGAALGALSGLSAWQRGVVWFDAHGDFNTPETTLSGFLDGMPLAIAAGRAWQSLAGRIPGYTPVPDECILHAGLRDVDAGEQRLLDESQVMVVGAEKFNRKGPGALESALDKLAGRVDCVYIHLDLDVLNPGEMIVNAYSVPGGISVDQLARAIDLIGERFTIRGAGLASYDPAYDPDGRVVEAGKLLLERLLAYAR